MDPKIFKSYDIRGIYPEEINEDAAYRISRATVKFLGAKSIAIGRDVRESSEPLFEALANGITDEGCDVVDIGLASTPQLYFASWRLPVDGAISLTASHNPPEWNGMKINRKNAEPVGGSELQELRQIAEGDFEDSAEQKGAIIPVEIADEYTDYIASFFTAGVDAEQKEIAVVADTANAMGVLELPVFERLNKNIAIYPMFDDLMNPFSAHEANPLKVETLVELQEKVVALGADLGLSYDGDADRVGFVDEKGEIVSMDLITALVAQEVLREHPGATILYDLRSSTSVKEIIEENGGVAKECVVGHAHIKKQLRKDNGIFAGELSGHYYFAENSLAEASTLAAIYIINRLFASGKKLSELVAEVKRYYHSGEINFEVSDSKKILKALEEKYGKMPGAVVTHLDGLKISFLEHGKMGWWFNVRTSNTEPLLRLNLETKTPEMLAEKTEELRGVIGG